LGAYYLDPATRATVAQSLVNVDHAEAADASSIRFILKIRTRRLPRLLDGVAAVDHPLQQVYNEIDHDDPDGNLAPGCSRARTPRRGSGRMPHIVRVWQDTVSSSRTTRPAARSTHRTADVLGCG
jgi:hypothetical protein